MTETLDIRRKRLLFRSWHRGTKETDLLVGSFAERHLAAFSAAELDRYEALLDNDDGDLFDWITGRASPLPECDDDMLSRLRKFKYTARPA
jgi:antitoxin CptB